MTLSKTIYCLSKSELVRCPGIELILYSTTELCHSMANVNSLFWIYQKLLLTIAKREMSRMKKFIAQLLVKIYFMLRPNIAKYICYLAPEIANNEYRHIRARIIRAESDSMRRALLAFGSWLSTSLDH